MTVNELQELIKNLPANGIVEVDQGAGFWRELKETSVRVIHGLFPVKYGDE